MNKMAIAQKRTSAAGTYLDRRYRTLSSGTMFTLLIYSVLTLFSVSAQAQTTWSRGMGLWVYVQLVPDNGWIFKCPPSKPDADSQVSLCRVFVQNGNVLCSRNPAEAGRRILILDGFSSATGGVGVPTRIQVRESDSKLHRGCWSVQQDEQVRVTSCRRGIGSHKIFVNPKSHSDGAYYFHSDHFSKPLRVGPDGFLMTSRVGAAVFCLYDTTYGKPIIPPGQVFQT
ncbi:hypothetical protein IWX47DRAFT_290111 [Phyllosticta citricarpa]|uniref:Uncharacterized protein n=1 Tax=Phyllosticta citricarpa TaxID=55181 RepID=A0ABR1M2V1_9PEZI